MPCAHPGRTSLLAICCLSLLLLCRPAPAHAQSTCPQPTSPGVNICSPVNGSTVTSPFTISAAGRNSVATDGLDVWLDGKKLGWYPGTVVNTQTSLATGSHQLDIYAVGVNGELQEKTSVF